MKCLKIIVKLYCCVSCHMCLIYFSDEQLRFCCDRCKALKVRRSWSVQLLFMCIMKIFSFSSIWIINHWVSKLNSLEKKSLLTSLTPLLPYRTTLCISERHAVNFSAERCGHGCFRDWPYFMCNCRSPLPSAHNILHCLLNVSLNVYLQTDKSS